MWFPPATTRWLSHRIGVLDGGVLGLVHGRELELGDLDCLRTAL